MRVLQLSSSDSGNYSGGAAVSLQRLHQGLRTAGVQSDLLCAHHADGEDLALCWAEERCNGLLGRVSRTLGLSTSYDLRALKIQQTPAYRQADILNLHTYHRFFSYLNLPWLTREKPTVLTLTDLWAFTGHCSYSFECDRWRTGCGQCPNLGVHPAIERDGTALEWRLKDWAYRQTRLTIVTKSRWMTKLVQQSMLSHFPVRQIYNGIDTAVYRPHDRNQCRQELGLPLDKKILLFLAARLEDPRKGYDLLLQALQKLPERLKGEILLLTLGQGSDLAMGVVQKSLGFVAEDERKARCYAAADLFIFPTRDEVFGNVALESVACGTPVVAFKVGGVPDLVRPGITGYLALPEDAEDLGRGIVELLNNEVLRQRMSKHCRTVAVREFALELQVQNYVTLYEELLLERRYVG
ncbi:glycosyltransferase [Anthocerotibacter panamensis]|uniref:glycosyltransferase n=1 Tax=Anthocerotibacter panamensis TaxID=2857077 RepID=UPI001C405C72|nr:glycosyltransferase [Anthocerotibacter panamensis]